MSNILSRTAALFVISVPLNFLWEVAQMPLYVEDGNLLEFAVHCIIPSLGDGIIVLVLVWLREDDRTGQTSRDRSVTR